MKHYELAESLKGLKEIPGAKDNPQIVQMFADIGHSQIDNDETAWCAAFVGSCLERTGLRSTGALNARSYLQWGKPVPLDKAQPGDVVVFWRESENSWKGHVAFYVRHSADTVWALGGNQKNEVRVSPYPRYRLLKNGVRRSTDMPTVRSKKRFTEALIRQIAPRARNDIAATLPAVLNKHLPKYKITTPKRIALFLANLMVETGGFKTLEENLNYSAKRLRQVWPSRFPTMAVANRYARNPEALANKVYGGRMGNTQKGDGWKFRGRGGMMTTGRFNYGEVESSSGLPVTSTPDLLLEVENAIVAACIFWRDHNLNALADAGEVTKARKVINGGTHGLPTVIKYNKKIQPIVRDLDLTYVDEKAVVGGGLIALLGGFLSQYGWTIAIGVGVALAAIAIGVMIYKRKKKRNVPAQNLRWKIPVQDPRWSEDLSAELHHSRRHDDRDGGSADDQLSGLGEPNSDSAA